MIDFGYKVSLKCFIFVFGCVWLILILCVKLMLNFVWYSVVGLVLVVVDFLVI